MLIEVAVQPGTTDDALIVQCDVLHESGFAGCRALLDLSDPPTAVSAPQRHHGAGRERRRPATPPATTEV